MTFPNITGRNLLIYARKKVVDVADSDVNEICMNSNMFPFNSDSGRHFFICDIQLEQLQYAEQNLIFFPFVSMSFYSKQRHLQIVRPVSFLPLSEIKKKMILCINSID